MKIKIKPESVGAPAAFLFKCWIRSLKIEEEGFEIVREMIRKKEPVMLSIWHSELFALAGFGMLENLPFVTMASDSKDGQFITEILERSGYKVARGSSTHGGVKAMMTMARLMKKENMAGIITVDGPKGPPHKFKHGILAISRMTNSVIIPIRAKHESAFLFKKSWDHFLLPKPFSKISIKVGEPYRVVSKKRDVEHFKAEAEELERRLNELGKWDMD